MSDLVSARAATADDLDITSALSAEELSTVRSERGGRWHLDHDRDRRAPRVLHQLALDESDETLVVGCIDDAVVGYGRARLSPTVDGVLCMIDELIVHPDARAIGVGSAILAELRRWAVDNGCQAIESQVLPGNRSAKNFFERVGMKTRKMRVSTDLG